MTVPPFELDRFQVEALAAVDAGRNVLVAAPTGSGKTVVAEHAVARALAGRRRAFYTTPVKALSNQKYADLARVHGAGQVGLLTGDNAVNPDAGVVVMTTEVLRNMIYGRARALDDLDWVVLDEVHYLQDAYRGPVWEEVLVHAPAPVRFVCLSATVSNAEELAAWIAATRGPTETVVEHERPVELVNHYLVAEKGTGRLVQLPTLVDGRPNREGDRFDAPERSGPRHQRHQRRGRRRWATPRRTEVVEHLAGSDLLPAICFIFSRAGCDAAARSVLEAGFRLTDAGERARIRALAARHTAHLGRDDLAVLGHDRWLAGLEAGVAAHHAGMVPPFKEAVEACFVEGLVKVVFATETLALGINMPARSVVVESLSKFTGEHHEALTPSQYTQLTGRAGRRGLDPVGHALVLWSPWSGFDEVAALAASREFVLRSAFRPTPNMVVNLVGRYDRDRAHELLGRSFAQFQADRGAARLAHRRASRARRLAGAEAEVTRGRGDVDERDRLRAQLTDLDRRLDERSGSLGRQFDRTAQLLERWGFLDGWAVTERGRVLARIFHEGDLLCAAVVCDGLLDGLDPPSLAGTVSLLTYEHRSKEPPPPPWYPSRRVRERAEAVERSVRRLARDQEEAGLPPTRSPDPSFLALAHAWAVGESLDVVMADEDLSGGDFVRNVKTLIDLLRQVGQVAPVPDTRRAAAAAADALFRGIVAVSSEVGAGLGSDPAPTGAAGEDRR